MNTTTTSTSVDITTTFIPWKPVGRGRRFDRLRRGLARRLRIPFVRHVRWAQTHSDAMPYAGAATYGAPWLSDHCLANFSFACTCHKSERYKRRPKHGKRADR